MGKGSVTDMLLQNNPMSKKIMEKSLLDINDYLIFTQDFTLKSQVIRCFEARANSSMKILFEMLFKINEFKYAPLIENDLVHIIH